ncbi:MAG: hypothetical protein WC758_00900 [Candidatus Woesearchaeota archaeon]|jgi:hypothetical protein
MDILENMICASGAKNNCNMLDNPSWFSERFNSELLKAALNSEHSSKIISAFESYPILDLACGDVQSVREMLNAIKLVNFKKYVGVDKFTIHKMGNGTIPCSAYNVSIKNWNYEQYGHLSTFEGSDFRDVVDASKISFMKEDVLIFVSLLQPKHSFNVILGGLETKLFVHTQDLEYHKRLGEAIAELMAPGAVFLDAGNEFDFKNIVQGEKILIENKNKRYGGFIHIDSREKISIAPFEIEEQKIDLNSVIVEDHSGYGGYGKNDFSFFYRSLSPELMSSLKEFETYSVRLIYESNSKFKSAEQLIELKNLREDLNGVILDLNKSENKYFILEALKNTSNSLPFFKELIGKLDVSYLSENLTITGDLSKTRIDDRLEILNRTPEGLRKVNEVINVFRYFSQFYVSVRDYDIYENAYPFLNQILKLQEKYELASQISSNEINECNESIAHIIYGMNDDLPF